MHLLHTFIDTSTSMRNTNNLQIPTRNVRYMFLQKKIKYYTTQ